MRTPFFVIWRLEQILSVTSLRESSASEIVNSAPERASVPQWKLSSVLSTRRCAKLFVKNFPMPRELEAAAAAPPPVPDEVSGALKTPKFAKT